MAGLSAKQCRGVGRNVPQKCARARSENGIALDRLVHLGGLVTPGWRRRARLAQSRCHAQRRVLANRLARYRGRHDYRTKQTDDVDSTEVTPRLGVRFHLFSRALRFHPREKAPRRRIVVRELVRVESRNFIYSGGDPESESTLRFRNRLELLLPLNKERITDDGARYYFARSVATLRENGCCASGWTQCHGLADHRCSTRSICTWRGRNGTMMRWCGCGWRLKEMPAMRVTCSSTASPCMTPAGG